MNRRDGVSTADAEYFREWVRTYIAGFYTDDEYVNMNVRLKEDHTRRVCENVEAIGAELALPPEALPLAEATALFHDIGRFEQFRRYRTFNDSRSENHALLSVRVIEENGVLARLRENDREIILRSVRYHNVRLLPSDESPDTLFFARLLRDADKLDIYHVVTDYYTKRHHTANPAVELDLPDTPGYSPLIIEDILNGKCTDGSNLETYNDMKLFELSWVFDINFPPTFRRLLDNRYIDRIVDALPDTPDIRRVRRHILRYIEARLTSA
jgi:hypothetical protein